MPHATCIRYEEDLALLAGGDLPLGSEHDRLLVHVEGCAACRLLLAELEGDRNVFAALAQTVELESEVEIGTEEFAGAVLAQVAGSVVSTPSVSTGRFPGRSHSVPGRSHLFSGRSHSALRAVAAAAVLTLGFLGVQGGIGGIAWNEGGSEGAVIRTASLETVDASLPGERLDDGRLHDGRLYDGSLRVRRAGGSLEFSWDADGRQAVLADATPTYKIRASPTAHDFEAGEAVEVAGNRLLTSMPFPARQDANRALTFFRVE